MMTSIMKDCIFVICKPNEVQMISCNFLHTHDNQHYKRLHTTLAGALAAVFSSILLSVLATRRELPGSEAFST